MYSSKLEQYPIPRVEDLFATVTGGKFFTKLDMSHSYQQIELDDASKQYVVINTHKGLSIWVHLHCLTYNACVHTNITWSYWGYIKECETL